MRPQIKILSRDIRRISFYSNIDPSYRRVKRSEDGKTNGFTA